MYIFRLCIIVILSLLFTGCSTGEVNNENENENETMEQLTVQSTTEKVACSTEETTEETTEEKASGTLTNEQLAVEILGNMTLEEKVGQMFIARCPKSDAANLAKEYNLGGYILFADDFKNKTKAEVVTNISSYQDASKIPMFIGVDEEGGIVVRVSRYKEFRNEPFKSPQDLYALGGMDLIINDTREKSRLLKGLGINLNFAPVADVSTDANDFIYDRTFGKDAKDTAEYIKNMISVMNEEKLGSVLKHFPGYGNNEDTHIGIAYDNRDYEGFITSDFIPFEAGIDEGAGMIMVAHNIVYCMDGNYPASLSKRVHEILRNELGYDGVIITDELSMDGVQNFAGDSDVAVMAVKAGNDLLCCTNFEVQIKAVIDAVKNGEISEDTIDEAVLRILKLKMELGIIQ